MADIFISYSQKDRSRVERLVNALTAAGYDVWWDLNIRAGESFDKLIESTLAKTSCVVGVWSRNSVESEWVRAESAWAKQHNIFVSVRIDDDVPLPLYFHNVHTASLVGWDGSTQATAFRKLVEDISALAPLHGSHDEHRQPLSTFGDSLRDGGEGPEMVVIPAGSFWMGRSTNEQALERNKLLVPDVARLMRDNDGPRHRVEITVPYALGKTVVTYVDYDRFAGVTNRKRPADAGWGRGDRPVIEVSWADAVAYAEWLCEQSGRRYRLPSEAEWEYAARAGSQTHWSFGDEASELGTYAWFWENSDGKTHPVGLKQANPWGLYDVHGNVWEWVEDCWHDTYDGAPADGSAWKTEQGGDCGRHVVRGGSWNGTAKDVRSTIRGNHKSDLRSIGLGFRLARDLD